MNVGFVETTSAQVDVRLALSFMSSPCPKNGINWATAREHVGVFGASLIKTSPLASDMMSFKGSVFLSLCQRY